MPSSLQRVEASTKEKQNKTKQIYITRVEIHLSGPASLVSVLLVPCSIFDYAFLAFFFCAKSSVNELIACLPHIEWMDGWFFFSLFLHGPYSYMFNLAEFTDDANICSCKQGKRLIRFLYALWERPKTHSQQNPSARLFPYFCSGH